MEAKEGSPSEGDGLDSEVVERTLARLELADGEADYTVAIMDYETGINHSVRGVAGSRQGGDCRLAAPDLTFTATSCSKVTT